MNIAVTSKFPFEAAGSMTALAMMNEMTMSPFTSAGVQLWLAAGPDAIELLAPADRVARDIFSALESGAGDQRLLHALAMQFQTEVLEHPAASRHGQWFDLRIQRIGADRRLPDDFNTGAAAVTRFVALPGIGTTSSRGDLSVPEMRAFCHEWSEAGTSALIFTATPSLIVDNIDAGAQELDAAQVRQIELLRVRMLNEALGASMQGLEAQGAVMGALRNMGAHTAAYAQAGGGATASNALRQESRNLMDALARGALQASALPPAQQHLAIKLKNFQRQLRATGALAEKQPPRIQVSPRATSTAAAARVGIARPGVMPAGRPAVVRAGYAKSAFAAARGATGAPASQLLPQTRAPLRSGAPASPIANMAAFRSPALSAATRIDGPVPTPASTASRSALSLAGLSAGPALATMIAVAVPGHMAAVMSGQISPVAMSSVATAPVAATVPAAGAATPAAIQAAGTMPKAVVAAAEPVAAIATPTAAAPSAEAGAVDASAAQNVIGATTLADAPATAPMTAVQSVAETVAPVAAALAWSAPDDARVPSQTPSMLFKSGTYQAGLDQARLAVSPVAMFVPPAVAAAVREPPVKKKFRLAAKGACENCTGGICETCTRGKYSPEKVAAGLNAIKNKFG